MDIETHPFEPWLPANAKLLMLGTFPPAPKRWAMEWYYPNFTNDMWRIMGIIFFNDKYHFVDKEHKTYKLNELMPFLKEKGIALFDTALRIRRTTGTASDKDLEIIEEADLDAEIEKIAKAYGMEKDVLKSALRPEDTENITKDIKVQKAVQFIKDNAVEA